MARRGIELEVKFAPVGESTLDALATCTDFLGWRILSRQNEQQENTYYDTPDALLEAAHCSLRQRVFTAGAPGVEWTFKRGRGPGRDGVARRREVNAYLPGTPPASKESFPKSKCAPVERARKLAGGQPLQPLFTLLTTREQIELERTDGARVALALDRLQLAENPAYRETEVEIELLAGAEEAVAALALWLMHTYGLLPMRGSKRGRALAWLRGLGLPVVAPAVGLAILAEQVAHAAPQTVVQLASPRGSEQAQKLANALHRLAAPAEQAQVAARVYVGSEPAAPVAFAAWVKVGLPKPLLGRIAADIEAAGVDPWAALRRFGEYVVPSQRRSLDPVAHDFDLIVIDNAPIPDADQHHTPTVQRKLYGWPAEAVLCQQGFTLFSVAAEEDHFLLPPAATDYAYLRVRLREDTAWVSYPEAHDPAVIATHEARPRVVPLLRNLGYRWQGRLLKERRRYRQGGWELTLDRVAHLGYFCELRQITGDQRDLDTTLACLGLATIRQTTASYWSLVQAQPEEPPAFHIV